MSQRSYHKISGTQGLRHVYYPFCFTPVGATTSVTMGEGDPAGSYFTVTRGSSGVAGVTGTTGTYLMQTNDPFSGFINAHIDFQVAGNPTDWTAVLGPPVQQSNSTWIIPFTAMLAGAATDFPTTAGNQILVTVKMRNSINKP